MAPALVQAKGNETVMTMDLLETPVEADIPAVDQPLAATIGKNTVFGILSGFTQVATRLVTIPIVIAHLGLGATVFGQSS